MRVHPILGYGFLKSAYGDALEIEFKKSDIPYVREDDAWARATTRRGFAIVAIVVEPQSGAELQTGLKTEVKTEPKLSLAQGSQF